MPYQKIVADEILNLKIIKTKFDTLQGKYTEITLGTPRRTLPKRLAAMERRVQA